MFIIDTLDFSTKLYKAGLKKEVCKVLTEEFKKAGEQSIENLATKNDIKLVKQEIKLVRQEIKTAMLTTIISVGTIVALIEKFIN